MKARLNVILILITAIVFGNDKIAFLENKGQWEEHIEFRTCTKEGSIFLEKDKLTFVFINQEDIAAAARYDSPLNHLGSESDGQSGDYNIYFHAYNIEFLNANIEPQIAGEDKRSEYYNFFIGNDASKWAGDVKAYNKIRYAQLYNDIDLLVYSEEHRIKYDLIINPGGNIEDIQFNYNGVDEITIQDGSLIIKTSVKELKELPPYAYQVINGRHVEVECHYKLEGTVLSYFFPDGYDETLPLIIDPTIEGCTFAGTASGVATYTVGGPITYDDNGDIYVGARSYSAGYPLTSGAYQSSSMGATWAPSFISTVGVSKYSSDLSTLIYSTYLGGTDKDVAQSIYVMNEEVYIYGVTRSMNFPVSASAFNTVINGCDDLFVTHFDNTGTNIIGSTYIGGSYQDGDYLHPNFGNYRGEIVVDNVGNAYIATVTRSTDFPTTAGAYQTTTPGNGYWCDGVIFSFNQDMSALNWSTYFSDTLSDCAHGIELDANGDIYVCGTLQGPILPVAWPYQPLPNPNSSYTGGYIAKFSSDGSTLLASTYTNNYNNGVHHIEINEDGDVYVCGGGGNLYYMTPTPGKYYTPGSGTKDYVAKYNSALDIMYYHTCIGGYAGPNNYFVSSFMVDKCDRIFVTGTRYSPGYMSGWPVNYTTGAFSSQGGMYIIALTPGATNLMFGSFIQGACESESANYTSRYDPEGIIYESLTSCGSYSLDMPVTSGAYANVNNTSDCDMAILKIDFSISDVVSEFQIDTIDTVCTSTPIQFINNSHNATDYYWDFGDGITSNLTDPIHNYSNPGVYEVMLIAENIMTCNLSDTSYYTINIIDCDLQVSDTTICYGDTASIYASGHNIETYTWSNGLASGPGPHFVAPLVTTHYYITATDSLGGTHYDTASVTVVPLPVVDLGQDTFICANSTYSMDAGNPGCTYLWQDGTTGQIYTPNTTGSYSVTVTNSTGCIGYDSVFIEFGIFDFDTLVTSLSCYNGNDGEIDLTVSGIPPYSYNWSNGQTTQDITGLSANIYEVTITDGAGCEFIIDIPVIQPPEIVLNTMSSNVSCYTFSDGDIQLYVSGGTPSYTYQWSNGDISQNISNLIAGIYTVTVLDANSCSAITSVSITEPGVLMSDISPTHNLCYGDHEGIADLTVTGGTSPYSYNWSNGATTEDLYNIPMGIYTVTISDINNCEIIDNIVINGIDSPIVATFYIDNPLCFGDEIGNISVTLSGGTPPYSYVWSSGHTGLSLQNIPAGAYTITVTDHNGCTLVSTGYIIEPNPVISSLPTDYTMCLNFIDTIEISVTGGTSPYNYEWSNGGNSNNIIISPQSETTYYVTITDVNGCENTNEITVDIYPPMNISAFSNVDTVCPGEPVILDASIWGGMGPPYYVEINQMPVVLPYVVYPSGNQVYVYEVSDNCGYQTMDQVGLDNYPVPPLIFSSDISKGCAPLSVQFNEYGGCTNCSYLWSFDDFNHMNSSVNHNPVHIFQDEGYYDITCTVTNQYGCMNSLTITDMIYVFPEPIADFYPDPEIASIIKPLINFYNQSIEAVDYHWFFGDGNSSNQVNPYHLYNDVGNYIVELIAISANGCKDTAHYTVAIKDEFTFYAPTAFSPDGDDINDIFYVFGNGIDNNNFGLYIYDRWGEVIYECNDIYEGWDGRVKGKSIAKNGSYAWLCIYRDNNGVRHEVTGSVTIIR